MLLQIRLIMRILMPLNMLWVWRLYIP
ncbi:hypothetical protein EMIT047CA2_90039 [Pseudomonas soli]